MLSPAARRLSPLFIATFFQAIPFWYAIEKLFMQGIGFNTASIGVAVAVMSLVMIAVETPSGILADRWSRKGVMLIGCTALLLSGLVGALSFTESAYIVSVMLWGIYGAFYSGTYDSVIYDTLIEEQGKSDKFSKYLGVFRAVEGASYVLGALAGGLIATIFELRDAYIFSLPLIGIALIFLWRFKEPRLHKAQVSEPVFKHIKQTFGAVLKNPYVLPILIATVGFLVIQDMLFSLNQLWFIAAATPIALYGVFSAVLSSSWITGGLLASRLHAKRSMGVVVGLIVIMTVLLMISRDSFGILLVLFFLLTLLLAIGVLLIKLMQDELPSHLRAGSASVVSTIARIVLIPASILVTTIGQLNDIFAGTAVLICIAVLSALAFIFIPAHKKVRE